MKKLTLLIATLLLIAPRVSADEGMWLLPMLEKLNIKDMKAKGMKLSAKDIYDINANSLKDAIVIFGGGCTGEVVSSEGLLLTNHHCGFGAIQKLSSVNYDYLKNGFWAMNNKEELPAEGLSVKFIRHIEDVTEGALAGVVDADTEVQRNEKSKQNIKQITTEYEKNNLGKTVLVKSFFGGNQFFLFSIEEYKDVRLVGTPPSSIGKFGGDTDNWMWPRHTGDFSVFRIYSNTEGRPAEYSKDNVPYQSPTHLTISTKKIKEGDFAMIMGFPGSTKRYMTSYEIEKTLAQENPIRIFVRGERQDILKKDMAASDRVRIQYASKYAGSSNYWKNSIGMSRGLKKLNVKSKKEAIEANFTKWANADESRAKYRTALPLIEESVKESAKSDKVTQYISEALLRSVEIIQVSAIARNLEKKEVTPADVEGAKSAIAAFYKDYNEATDRKVAKSMFKIIFDSLSTTEQPTYIQEQIAANFDGDVSKYVDYLYDSSIFANQAKFNAYVAKGDFSTIASDPAVKAREDIYKTNNTYSAMSAKYRAQFAEGHRLFVDGVIKMDGDSKTHYPDANFTLRLTYGNVLPYNPADAVTYNYFTTLSGIIAKEDRSNPVDFTVPSRLKKLYEAKDFGEYAENGDIRVGFISNNDITGGNSGSPVLNGKGELIGLVFDGNWEAMSGDIAFEPELQRSISVDIRYVLFIIEKYGNAEWLIDEMTIAN